MARLQINPKYRDMLDALGLRSVGDFMHLDGVILWGHPDRSVECVTLGSGAMRAYLKKERRIRWRDRGRNAWAGFGFASKSMREYSLLRDLHEAGLGGPEVLAAGEANGQAFVLVREVAGGQDLREYLRKPMSPENRRALFRELGRSIARLHAAGFVHPDLYAKHILVIDDDSWRFAFIDWQRGSRTATPTPSWRHLAKLEATLPDSLGSPRNRLVCLRAYLRSLGLGSSFRARTRWLQSASQALQRRRQIQETRQPPLPAGMQHLIQVGDTSLYVTRDLPERWARNVATWLSHSIAGEAETREAVAVQAHQEGHLVRRRTRRFWDWFNRAVRGRPVTSPDFENAAKLFRLQRFGVRTPRLLAVGHRATGPGETVSFLLTEHPARAITLAEWCSRGHDTSSRRRCLSELADLVRRIHKSGYFFDCDALVMAQQFLVEEDDVLLRGVEHLRRRFPLSPQRIRKDLGSMDRAFAGCFSRTERLRFLLSYLQVAHSSFSTKNLVRSCFSSSRQEVPACR